ncbi:MAG TPA: type II secretion system F family protein [Thermoflexia bacterium]|jgi:type IV pilus assembly protein PilC|nr:type II secretion system F family protein [Thermoflexia bacterium]
MEYRYIAFDQEGQRVEGWIDVPDEAAAERILWERGLTVAQLVPARQELRLWRLFPTFFGVKRRDLIIFSRQLATLLTSGISILPALRLLAEQSTSKPLREILGEVAEAVERGQSFSAALAAHPYAFPPLYTRTLAIGERTGNLEEVLRRLATYLEQAQELSRKLREALAYPVFVLAVAIFVVVLMLTVALPPMVQLFENFGADLPWTTRALIAFTRWTTAYGLYVLFGALALTIGLAWWGTRPSGRRVRDAVMLRLPLIGQVVLEGQIARFARTAATLIRAGLPLSEVMELAVSTAGNTVVAEALERVRIALLTGQGLSGPLAAEPLFPPLLAQMTRVGEESGTLEENLETVADFYEEGVDRKMRLLVSFVEPALTIFVGLIVGFIALSMVMPMYSVLSSIR